MSFTYTPGVPDGPHNPSQDWSPMQQNTNSIQAIVARDHFGFNNANGGWHQQSTYPQQLTAATTLGGQGALYSKAGVQGTQLFWVRDGVTSPVTTEVPLTIASSGIVTPYSRTTNGFTFLPGNILIQWGFSPVTPDGTGTINFTPNFAVVSGFVPIVTITPFNSSSSGNTVYITATSSAGFGYNNQSTAVANIYWIAIGPI